MARFIATRSPRRGQLIHERERAEPYDPLSSDNLAESIVTALEHQPLSSLPPRVSVNGIGVYVLYYRGRFPAYRRLVRSRRLSPVYVGKAVPRGTRTGQGGVTQEERARVIDRLRAHARSITRVRNLRLTDFRCRYLVLAKEVYVFLAESLLIRRHRPMWNTVVTGFGNNPVGGGRTGQQLSRWDTLHPGRAGTPRRRGRLRSEEILRLVRDHFRARPASL